MGYRAKTIDEVERASGRIEPRFSGSKESDRMTQLPLAVTSWVLYSIDFIGIVNSRVKWDPARCGVAPGDALKARIMTMVLGAYRPALENVARRYTGQPMELYFESVSDPMQLDPDMLARTLTKLHEANALVNVINMAALVKAVTQLLIRRGLESLPDEELPRCGYGLGPLQRKVTTEFFVDSCMNCYIRYDRTTNSYAVMGDESDCRASAYLSLVGIPEDRLFAPSL